MAAEIAIAAAGIVLSPFLQAFFERMAAPEFDGFFWGRKVSNKLLRKLEIALLSVNAVLEDAEGRQFMETSVKKWLDEVKDIVYDVEDILDEIATKELQHKLDSEFGIIASKLWSRSSRMKYKLHLCAHGFGCLDQRLVLTSSQRVRMVNPLSFVSDWVKRVNDACCHKCPIQLTF